MQVDCTQVNLDEDGRIVCTIFVENNTADTDTINHIHLVETKPDAEGGVSFLKSIPQVDVVLPPGAVWEGNFTWSFDESARIRQLGEAMVLVEFAHSQPVGSAFMLAGVQDGESEVGGFWQRAQLIGRALIIASVIVAIFAVARHYLPSH